MQVRDWMTRNVVTVTPDTSILNARRLLDAYDIRHLPVIDEGRVVGMVSSRDIRFGDRTLAAALAALRSDLADGRFRPVSAIMDTPARTAVSLSPGAASRMLDARIGALAVVAGDRLVGLLSLVDCVRAFLASEREQDRRATRLAATEDDPERFLSLPFPPGDVRPGRSARPRPVDEDDRPATVGPPERTTGRKAG